MKTHHRFVGITIIGMICIVLGSGCSPEAPPQQPPIRLSINAWPGFLVPVIAQNKGFFSSRNVEVEVSFVRDSQKQMSEFAAGKHDAAALALGSVITLSSHINDLRVILVTDYSTGADAIVAASSIQKISDLAGKRIGGMLGGFGELIIDEMLAREGLARADVIMVNMDGSDIPNQIGKQNIEAGQTWEPYVSQSLEHGARVIFDSSQTPGLIPDVVAFRAGFVEEHPDLIRAFLDGWFEAADYWLAHREESQQLIARELDLPYEECSLDGMTLLNKRGNQAAFGLVPSDIPDLTSVARRYADFFVLTGTMNVAAEVETIVDSSFVGVPE